MTLEILILIMIQYVVYHSYKRATKFLLKYDILINIFQNKNAYKLNIRYLAGHDGQMQRSL